MILNETDLVTALPDVLAYEIPGLLARLGKGETSSVAYDTGWLARLSLRFPGQGFDGAYEWLLLNQHDDGSWGSSITHYHDRIICTLSAVVAFQQALKDDYARPIARGINYIWRTIDNLYADSNDTINFRGVASLLMREAAAAGLDVPQDLYTKHSTSQKKLLALRNRPDIWATHPICHSLECFGLALPDAASVITTNGSVGVSPTASIALLLNSTLPDSRVMTYLANTVSQDGGMATVSPIDVFEIVWSLNPLFQNRVVEADNALVKRCLDSIWPYWSAEHGISHATPFLPPDLDDTATAYQVFKRANYPVSPSVFGFYEEADHFRCYRDETDSSLSAHIRLLAALKTEPDYPSTQCWVEKIISFLQRHSENNGVWTDKWHASPLYLRSSAAIALHGLNDDLALKHVKWIVKTQRDDGGWGRFHTSTAEETAYALHALLYWHRHVHYIDSPVIQSGIWYLMDHLHDPYIPLWIGKCLYTPPQVVHAAILAVLCNYQTL